MNKGMEITFKNAYALVKVQALYSRIIHHITLYMILNTVQVPSLDNMKSLLIYCIRILRGFDFGILQRFENHTLYLLHS